MKSRGMLRRLVCLLLVIFLIGSVTVLATGSEGEETLADILSGMDIMAASDFDAAEADTALAETSFANDWSVILAGGGTAVIKSETDGNYVQFDKYSALELIDIYFGPNEAYAVSYQGKFGEKGHNYLFVRGTQVLKRNGTVMNWYESDGSGAGSGVGGSGISFRVYDDDKIQVSIKKNDESKGKHVNTSAVLIDAFAEGEGTLSSEYHTYTCYDNGKGLVQFFIDGELKATVSYSNITTYSDDEYETVASDLNNPIHAQYYKDVVVTDANGTNKLTVTDALVAVNGRVAFGHRNVTGVCYKDIKVYSDTQKIPMRNVQKYGAGNLSKLTGNESTKRCFPSIDTFVYFRNTGEMAAAIGNIDLSNYDRVAITWWDASNGNARTLAAGSVNFALTSTGALDTTASPRVEQTGVNKLTYWSLPESKAITAKEDFRSAETIILPLDTSYSGNVYLAYMGNHTGIAVSQITFYKKTAQSSTLRFTAASLSLENDISINFKTSRSIIDNVFDNVYARFNMHGKEYIVEGRLSGDKYVFTFDHIAPHYMNDAVTATLFGTQNGTEYASAPIEYSIASYCYGMIDSDYADNNSEFKTMLVDLLNYGAACQAYMNYHTDDFVNSDLTSEEAGCGTQTDPVLDSVYEIGNTIADPDVEWTAVGLILRNSVVMRIKFTAASTEGLVIKAQKGSAITEYTATDFAEGDNCYMLYFEEFDASEMSEAITFTAYVGAQQVSNVLAYSVESYAYETISSGSDANLVALLKALMKYGYAAYNYVDSLQ